MFLGLADGIVGQSLGFPELARREQLVVRRQKTLGMGVVQSLPTHIVGQVPGGRLDRPLVDVPIAQQRTHSNTPGLVVAFAIGSI